MCRIATAICLAAALLGAAAVPAAAGERPLSTDAIIVKLNRERAALGMVPLVTEDARRTQGCRLHNRWMRINRTVAHGETPGTRGFTELGNEAGMSSVLSDDPRGWHFINPWINAPIHLSQVYNPGLRTTGAADSDGHSCMSTWPGIDTANIAPGDAVWTFPAEGGLTPYAQLAFESPYTPQQQVGIRATTVTGPYLYVWSRSLETQPVGYDPSGNPVYPEGGYQAPLGRLVRGSLTGPGGRAVPAVVIDNAEVDNYIAPGNGWLLPIRPLKPRTTYTATVVLAPDARAYPASQREYTHTWTFRTGSSTLDATGYHRPPSASKRKRCKRLRGAARRACLAGPATGVLR